MKRITVQSFIRAVRKTGVVPRRCLWIKPGTDTTYACAIGALTVEAGRKDYHQYARATDGLGLTSAYITGRDLFLGQASCLKAFTGHERGPFGATLAPLFRGEA